MRLLSTETTPQAGPICQKKCGGLTIFSETLCQWKAMTLTRGPQVHVLDLGSEFTNPDGTLKTALYSDGHLHLGPAGYEVCASKLQSVVNRLLAKPSPSFQTSTIKPILTLLTALLRPPGLALVQQRVNAATDASPLHRLGAWTPQGWRQRFRPASEPLAFGSAHRGGPQPGFSGE